MAPPVHRQPVSKEEAERRLALLREAELKELAELSRPPKDKPWMDMKIRRKSARKPSIWQSASAITD